MSRILHGIEKGIRVYGENSETIYVDKLIGSGAPIGTSGDTDAASIGSTYQDYTNGKMYIKQTDTSSAGDWIAVGNVTIDQLSWRNEKVAAATNDTVVAGSNIDPSAWSDNDDGFTPVVGQYILGDADGAPALFEITVVTSSTDIDLVAASTAIASNDTFIVQNFLPDGTGQEDQALFHIPIAGSAGIKIGDVNWNFADGIGMAAGYSASSGNVTSADTVQTAIQKVDGVNDAQDTTLGTAQGATDLGTFTGVTISDNVSVKVGMQELETAYEETDANVDDLITLSGVAENATDLGTFTGDCIPDASDNKEALQALETCIEEGRKQVNGTIPINTPTVLDSISVDDYQRATWILVARETANPARVRSLELNAIHNGHSAADATKTDDSISERLNIGNVNLQISTTVSGAAGAQVMNFVLETNETGGVTYTLERTSFLPLAG